MITIFPKVSDNIIQLVSFSEYHLKERYVRWLNDPVVVRYSKQRHFRHTIESCRQYYQSQNKSNNYFLAIEALEHNPGHIGNISIAIDVHNSIADISIMIGEKEAWGKGLGTRAWILSMNTLFNKLNIRLITAGTMEVNKPMIRLMEKSGMHIDANLPERFIWENRETGLISASLSRKFWISQHD